MLKRLSAPFRLFAASSLLASSLVATSAKATEPETIQPGRTLAGNYLAARIAATDQDTESATTFYRQAMLLDSTDIGLKQRAFQAFIANGDFDEGVDLGRELVKLDAAPELTGIILSVDDMRSKAWKAAAAKLEKPWRSAVDRLIAGLLQSWAQAGAGDSKGALETLNGLSGPAWFDLFVDYHAGLIAVNAGDMETGLTRLEKAHANQAAGRAANYTYMRVTRALLEARWKADDKKGAMDISELAVRLQPQNPVFAALLADLTSGNGPKMSVATPQAGAAEVFMNLGTAINRDGGSLFARIYLQLASILAPNSEAVSMQLADLYDQIGLRARSNELFGRVEQTSPYNRIARLEIALNLDEDGNLHAARQIMDKLIKADPMDLTAHLSYGAVLARHDKFDEAIPIYQSLIDRISAPQRQHWALFYRQGIAFERTKQWPKAERAFKKALDLFPNQPSVLNYLGYSWVDMGINLQEGLDLIRKAVQIRPNDGYMVDSLGWAYYRLGRFEEAVVDLERAVSLRPADPTINDHLGDAYWRAGRKLEATFQWQHALSLEPSKEDEAKIRAKLENGLGDDEPASAKPEMETDDEAEPDNG